MHIADILLLLGIIIAIGAQIYVSVSIAKYKKVKNSKNISGFEIARQILDDNDLSNVYVTETKGHLSDHYDPARKVVRLSSDIFHGTTVAAAAIAAHEAGHAIQDKDNYSFMKFRKAMFPIVRISSYAGFLAILIGIIFEAIDLIWLGIGLEIIILIFQLVTLPVEFDASRRAKSELKKNNFLTSKEFEGGNKMLRAAAYTYVASVVTSLLQVLRLIIIFGGNRRD